MKASEILLSLGNESLEVWRYQTNSGGIGVCYKGCEIKDGPFLIGAHGRGTTFEEACESYLEKIKGKTLVFNAYSHSRYEVKFITNYETQAAVRYGIWIKSDIPCERFKCSECGGGCWYYDYQGSVAKSRYCPNCGAKMDLKNGKT